MKFAVVGADRREAQPGLVAQCPVCTADMIAKCGEQKVWHWAHRGRLICDRWWESETKWHRDWKGCFPEDWQEVVHIAKDGEKHIADVKTGAGIVVEFQHSYLRPEERAARENFYPKMVWVVDGRRRLRDRTQFFASLGTPRVVLGTFVIFSVPSGEGALLRDWKASRVPVYFDFGVSEPNEAPSLWRLNPGTNQTAYLSPVTKPSFLNVYLNGLDSDDHFTGVVNTAVAPPRTQVTPSRMAGFERFMGGNNRARRRL